MNFVDPRTDAWPPELEDVIRRLRAARQLEAMLTIAVTGQSSLMYRELLVWVLAEHHAGRPTSLKRCYLSLPFSEKNLRKAVKMLEDLGYLSLFTADGDRRKTLLSPTRNLLVTLAQRAKMAMHLANQLDGDIQSRLESSEDASADQAAPRR